MNALSQHPLDIRNTKKGGDSTKSSNGGSTGRNQAEKTSKEDEKLSLSFAQLEGCCYCCGKPGHLSSHCRKRDKIPKEEWHVNKMKNQKESPVREQSHAQKQQEEKPPKPKSSLKVEENAAISQGNTER